MKIAHFRAGTRGWMLSELKCCVPQQHGVGKGNIVLKQLFQGACFLKIILANTPACTLTKTTDYFSGKLM